MRESNRKISVLFLMIAISVSAIACRKSESSSQPTASVEPTQSKPSPQASPLTQFEKDLQYVRNGGYAYVWAFARKDGKPLDKDDAAYLRKTAPQVVDWVGTEEGKKYIGGTNFDLEKGNLELLKKRFVVEDYSGK
jgi:hypothetical protein